MACVKYLAVFLVLILKDGLAKLQWDGARCSADPNEEVPEGQTRDIGRFPWMGVVQHSFFVGGKERYAVAMGVYVHPRFVLAPADDMVKIPPNSMMNNTRFVVWYSQDIKFVVDVKDYILHPEYTEGSTYATLALLEIYTYGQIGLPDVRIRGKLTKEVYRMTFVPSKDCEEFYYKAQLSHTKMRPVNPICAVADQMTEPCVWDGGVALISRQTWGYWRLIGFGVRGPGCGAPARFVYIADYMEWIDAVISADLLKEPEFDDPDMHKIYFRRVSPITLTMYKADTNIPKEQGQCDRKERGGVLFKESSEISANRNFAQGFYLVSLMQIATFLCAIVHIECTARTNAAVWVEHHCYRDLAGLMPNMQGPDNTKLECFMYFKSNAFIEFRFTFSFKMTIELTFYGKDDVPKFVPNPWRPTDTTDKWEVTDPQLMRWGDWTPTSRAWWWL